MERLTAGNAPADSKASGVSRCDASPVHLVLRSVEKGTWERSWAAILVMRQP